MIEKTSTTRFTDYLDNYVKYRPDYPQAAIDALVRICNLGSTSVIADIGSGTGLLSRGLLARNLKVIGVEPNREMRQAAENLLTSFSGFKSVNGTAETTTLMNSSVDLIVAAQAFHWFNTRESLTEFSRILKPDGWLGLIWNRRNMEKPFQEEYDVMLRKYAPEYGVVNHMNIEDSDLAELFDSESFQNLSFDHFQILDEKAFLGRMQSSSYMPPSGSSTLAELIDAARQQFSRYQIDGRIMFQYITRVFLGKLDLRTDGLSEPNRENQL